VGYEALDNGLRSCGDPALAHRICARLGAGHLCRALERWLAWLPSPLVSEARRAGFAYDSSIRQLEVSDTAVFDCPHNGRAWFEAAIRNHLDVGRPDNVSLIFDRRLITKGKHPTPGRFATQVVTRGVDPQISIRYKSDKVKAYHKEQRALRRRDHHQQPRRLRRRASGHHRQPQGAVRIGADTNARFLACLGEGEPRAPDGDHAW
jgi:hypothetical protein